MIDRFEFYLEAISSCSSLEELDTLMFDCADDPTVTASDFVKLATHAKYMITSKGWIS